MSLLLTQFKALHTKTKLLLLLSLMLFIISLFYPAFTIDRDENPNAYSNSMILFSLGWMSILGGAIVPFIIWLANPLYIYSIYLIIREEKKGIITSTISSLLAIAFSQLDTIMTSESGSYSTITGLGTGYKLWAVSLSILTIGQFINRFFKYPSNGI